MKANYENWHILSNGKPYTFFIHYVPLWGNDSMSEDSLTLRQLIWDFKNGDRQRWARELIEKKIRETFDDPSELTFVCIPASSDHKNEMRFKRFSKKLCEATGMINGFKHIHIFADRQPRHLGGDPVENWQPDPEFFRGKKVILFDDIVKRGDSLRASASILEMAGASVVGYLSLGHTVPRVIDPSLRHPCTGTPVFG